MLTTTTPTLNQGQQDAADAFFQFLFSDEKSFRLSGPGGTGKTFLMQHFVDVLVPEYFEQCKMIGVEPAFDDLAICATTNKATEVLSQATGRLCHTIHSFLNLKVKNDFKTGKQVLSKKTTWKVHERYLVFIDECSMVDSELFALIHAGTHNCKLVFLGDHSQLAPVMERLSPVYRNQMSEAYLTEPVRNAEQPALMELCQQFRDTVETGEFGPIQIVPGVIDYVDDNGMMAEIETHFSEQTRDNRILCYTNARVEAYNDHIRDLRQLPPGYTVGELMVSNSAIAMKGTMLPVEAEVEITRLANTTSMIQVTPDTEMEVIQADLQATCGARFNSVYLPIDKDHFRELIKWFARKKDFSSMFGLKDTYPDLRPIDACTVYKAQGSTYDTVFVDLGDISTCPNPSQAARMLYVAVSRPRQRIVFYGDLAPRYGQLIAA